VLKYFSSSFRSLNLLKNVLEIPGKVLEFHLHERAETLKLIRNQFLVRINHMVYVLICFRFPLFVKGKEKFQFEFGVFLLNKNIAQVRVLYFTRNYTTP
jgi:hypothetical protein